jgi:adenylate cyclase
VNIAARLTGHARPDTVLVDREAAEALAVDPRFALRPLRPVAVPGYQHLHPWVLEPA